MILEGVTKPTHFWSGGGWGGNDFVQNISRKSSQLSPIPIHFQPSQILSAKLDLEYIVFFFPEYCCPDLPLKESRGCGGVTLGQF